MDTQTPTGDKSNKEIDPSILTTQQLWREIASLKEFLVTRIDSIEKAVDLAHVDLTRVPTEVQKAVSNLKELQDQKIGHILDKIQDRVAFVDTLFKDVAEVRNEKFIGVQTQFLSSKEAAEKQTETFTKLIDSQSNLLNSVTGALDNKVSDLRDRITSIEGAQSGKKDFSGYISWAIGLILALIGIFTFMMSIRK